MIVRKSMTDDVRKKIKTYIKNKIDVSDLIANYSIKDEDLSGAIIKKIVRISTDCSRVNLSRCIIGSEDELTDISSSDFSNSNFFRTRLIGRIKAQHTNFRNCNFNRAFAPVANYKGADFRGASFCDAFFKISGGAGKGARFDKKVMEDLLRDFIIE